ncbi:hypothetical protein IQ22_02000 [Pseudomonas duriflava]|uniref:Uncharacterized protein n=1 Tax=Pseudomonas duriflava TaxID=459528 RepID=A0A562QEA6_9PSED|nr:hypothetical protein IQ22_04317 [Pseudomonas duriflava]TWI55087.1 hypothetical protein IQ22_02000 [Pseudomonas duriflava]
MSFQSPELSGKGGQIWSRFQARQHGYTNVLAKSLLQCQDLILRVNGLAMDW